MKELASSSADATEKDVARETPDDGIATMHVQIIKLSESCNKQSVVVGNENIAKPSGKKRPEFWLYQTEQAIKGTKFTYGVTILHCTLCDYNTSTTKVLCDHLQTTHEQSADSFKCLYCTERFQTVKSLMHHISSDHSKYAGSTKLSRLDDILASENEQKVKKKKRRKGPATCEVCGKIFPFKQYLTKHMATHNEERNYLCSECGKAFNTKSSLTQHRRGHLRDGLFQCSQCDFSSYRQVSIQAHRQVHPHGCVLCEICGLAYKDKSTLNKHMQVHDPKRPFACIFPNCTWRFRSEVMCRAHIKGHTSEGKFGCVYCGYSFRHKHHLQRHQARIHGIDHKNPKQKATVRNVTTDGADFVLASSEMGEEPSQLIVTTDEDGRTIAYEATDISALSMALLQGTEKRTIYITDEEAS